MDKVAQEIFFYHLSSPLATSQLPGYAVSGLTRVTRNGPSLNFRRAPLLYLRPKYSNCVLLHRCCMIAPTDEQVETPLLSTVAI